jgi:hypothetical protein
MKGMLASYVLRRTHAIRTARRKQASTDAMTIMRLEISVIRGREWAQAL